MDDDEDSQSTLGLDSIDTDTTNCGDTVSSIIDIQKPNKNLEDECLCDSLFCKGIKLSKELDSILDPTIIFRSPAQLDKIWSLLTTAHIPPSDVTSNASLRNLTPATNVKVTDRESYLELLSQYKSDSRCGVPWPPSYVAYRCRTCSKSSDMALCADCFRDGDHVGHDYNMFKSISGGACDCGYSFVDEKGHCKRHGKNSKPKRFGVDLPQSLICIPQRSMGRLIHRLAIQLRRSHVDLLGETDIYLDCLNQIASSCAIMRSLMSDALISEEVYSSQLQLLSNHQDKEVVKILNEGLKKLEREQKGLTPFTIPREWETVSCNDINAFCDKLNFDCFLDELIFWIVVFEFPQKLVCYLLGFLIEPKYREAFSRAFVRQYPRIMLTLAAAKSEARMPRNLRDTYEQLSRRILQISVQIYNDDQQTKLLCDKEHTLHTIVYCLRIALEGSTNGTFRGVLKSNPLGSRAACQVVCCDNPIIRDRHLSSFTEDLNSILKCSSEALGLIKDKDLLTTWMMMLSYFQTMSPYKRELTEHTPYETGPHVSVFSIETDFCQAPLWTVLGHLQDDITLPLTKSLLEVQHLQLLSWLRRMNIGPNTILDPYHMSFHIPLHRMFSATVRHLLFTQRSTDQEVYDMLVEFQDDYDSKQPGRMTSEDDSPFFITVNDFFKMLIKHPLQALILYHETRSSMWTRNGLMTINQAVSYLHSAYSYSTHDLDMFLLRYSASKLNPNYFLRTLMSRFHSWKWLSFRSNNLMNNLTNNFNPWRRFCILPDQLTQMVENSLLVILQILTLSIHCDISQREQMKQEMVSIISVLDRSYSYLSDILPDMLPENFMSLLEELTDYKPAQHGFGGNLQQGCYTLKPQVWNEEYNPIQVQYRFYQKRDYQMSLERFFQNAKLTGKLQKKFLPSSLWPPLRIPKMIGKFAELDLNPILDCQTLVGIVYCVIFKNIYITDVPDVIMAYTIHLLELALRKCSEKNSKASVLQHLSSNSQHLQTHHSNWSFRGSYCFGELISRPSCLASKAEMSTIGNILCSEAKQETQFEDLKNVNSRMFPIVRHALDLSFDSTWFPFKSILDNCLVHIESVYSLSSKEFNLLLAGDTKDSKKQATTAKSSEPSTSNKSMSMSWFDELDEEDSFFGDDNQDESPDTDSLNETEEDDDDEDDEDDNEYNQDSMPPMVVISASRSSNPQGIVDSDMSDGELTEVVRERLFSNQRQTDSRADNIQNNQSRPDERRTQDRSTNTLTWTPAEQNQPALPSSSNRLSIRRAQDDDTLLDNIRAAIRREAWSSGANSVLSSSNVQSQSTSEQSVIQPTQQHDIQTLVPTESMIVDNVVEDVEMVSEVSGNEGVNTNQNDTTVQPSPSTSEQSSGAVQSVVDRGGDHTYSATETSMEIESPPEPVLSLVLVPVETQRQAQQQQHEGMVESGSQVYPENLVISRRSITAPPQRPMITGSNQPLALESSSSSISRRRPSSASDEQPLSEVDIQARFTGFFQTNRLDARQSSRGFRQRQTARRGGFRGPVPPFAVHNPNNTTRPQARNITIQVRDNESEGYVRTRQTARRSPNACTLLNRVLSSRMKPEERVKKTTKKDMLDHHESLLSLLLRLHAKYSQKPRSYEYNDTRAQLNRASNRSRIGDGAHFVTVILDLICSLDERMIAKIEQLEELIWPKKVRKQRNQEDLKGVQGQDCSFEPSKTINQSSVSDSSWPTGEQTINSFVKQEPGTSSSANTVTSVRDATATVLTPAERRRKAKELQSKLMTQFANKQKAFIEKYEATANLVAHGKIRVDGRPDSSLISGEEEPINLSSKLTQEESESHPMDSTTSNDNQEFEKPQTSYKFANDDRKEGTNTGDVMENKKESPKSNTGETDVGTSKTTTREPAPIFECCICGVEGPSDFANPLGQVVLLQSTSIYGHSHLRPKLDRLLPCEESEQQKLKEETYAKYLERRIDLLCEHFSESSWLDSVNIGAEGGVHVQSCGHCLHIECHQSYIKSLDQEDRIRSRTDSDEFLCPVCRQLANSVLPILSGIEGTQAVRSNEVLMSDETLPESFPSSYSPSSDQHITAVEQAKVDRDLEAQIRFLGTLFERRLPPDPKMLQSSAAFCSHLTKATGPQYRSIRSNPSMHSLFLFLTSIARTNLECEIIVRSMARTNCTGAGLSGPRRSCFQLLFHVLALNAHPLIKDQWFTCDEIWSRLTDHIDEKNRLSIKPVNSEVPLLLRDPTAMLLQFLFAITNSDETSKVCTRANFTCLVQMLFNLTAIQATALVLSYVNTSSLREEKLLDSSSGGSSSLDDSDDELRALLVAVSANLAPFLESAKEEPLRNATVRSCWTQLAGKNLGFGNNNSNNNKTNLIALIENRIKLVCFPFLRACAFIQHQLYQQDYPDLLTMNHDLLTDQDAIDSDFKTLASCLDLLAVDNAINDVPATTTSSSYSGDLINSIRWPLSEGGGGAGKSAAASLISSWSHELVHFGLEYSIAARTLLVCRSLVWHRPSLMLLPKKFDDIFMFYYRKKCSLCQQIPKDIAICLVCGAPICFRVSCCKDRSRSRQVHSQHCGANTAVFLAVHTSSVVVIRGNRACVWGSVYLDAHDEEDNGLQRGKPLYLVEARYNLLEEQWLTHSFDHTCGKRWIYLQENQ